jgi:putative oxidoreductase
MFKKIFDPGNDSKLTSLALLVLRVWLGVEMLWIHGSAKLRGFSEMSGSFPDPLHIGHTPSLVLAVFAECFASLLLVLGLATRFGALVLAINMTVAFFMVHQAVLMGEHSGELAFIYLAGYITLLLAGGGKFSADMLVFGKGR